MWPYLAGAALIAGALGGWTARDWKADADALAASDKAHAAEKAAAQQGYAQGSSYAQFAASNQQAATTERNTIREVYRNVEVPADCAVPGAAVSVLESARDRANAAASGEPGPALPGAANTAAATD